MNPVTWLEEYDAGSGMNRTKAARMISDLLPEGQPKLIRQTLNRYLDGTAFPPEAIIEAFRKMTRGAVMRRDWEEIARAAGHRPNYDEGFRNQYRGRRSPADAQEKDR
jgi:hypothetical protein